MQTTCSNCNTPMHCGAQEKSCWCQALPNLPPASVQPNAACLCTACLHAQLDAGVVLYGIANCDTVKKARAFLTENGVAYVFWDYRKNGVPSDKLAHWLTHFGWETLVNTRGTTWRGLDAAQKTAVVSNQTALAALIEHPAMIKRPVVMWGNTYAKQQTLGFDAAQWAALIKI